MIRVALMGLFLLVNSVVFAQTNPVTQRETGKSNVDELPPHLCKGPLKPGWEDRIVYSAESDKRLFWVASSGEPKWAEIRRKADSTLVARGIIAVPFLLTKLATDDARESQTVNLILKKIGKPAIPSLIAINDTTKDRDIKSMVLKTLGDIGDTSATSVLITASTDTSIRIRGAAASALMTMPAGVPVIMKRLRDFSHDSWAGIRRTSIRGLILMADIPSIPAILSCLADSSYPVRETTIQALSSRPTHHDSLQPGRLDQITAFRNALMDTLERRLKPSWRLDRYLSFRTGFGLFPDYREVRADEFPIKNTSMLATYIQVYRILQGTDGDIWHAAVVNPSPVVRAEALRAGTKRKLDGTISVESFAKPLLWDQDPQVYFVLREVSK